MVTNLVFSNVDGLWKICLRGGEPERLQVGQDGVEPSIRGKPTSLCSAQNRIRTSGRGTSTHWFRLNAAQINSYLPREWRSGPQFSPDGSEITFESTRSGAYEIWVCRSDGSSLMQLTHFSPSVTGTPRWSPDGQQITFDARPAGHVDIYVIDPQGGLLRNLTSEASNEIAPGWSETDGWIYYASIALAVGKDGRAFESRVRCTSDTSRWICSVRIA